MPELPEVEAARRAVEEHCKGGVVCRAVVADDTTVVEGMLPFDMQKTLVGKRIVAAHRKGKQLWLQMDQPPCLCFQFGMTGAVYIKGVKSTKYVRSAVNDEDEWPSKFSKVLLVLDNGVEMSFTDKRRFARVRLLDNPFASTPVSELGPDAYTELPDANSFANSVIKKKTSIKAVLLDQSFISGIGNWIADEVLYQSRIHPEQPASSLSVDDCKRLHEAIKEVLEIAVNSEADSAMYPKDWLYHHREKKKSAVEINGKKIEFITVGGRTSAYVPELQKYDGLPKKKKAPRKVSAKQADDEDDDDADVEKETTKSRGNKKKKDDEPQKVAKSKQEEKDNVDESEKPKGKRGRPRKSTSAASKSTSAASKVGTVYKSSSEESDEGPDDDDNDDDYDDKKKVKHGPKTKTQRGKRVKQRA